MKASNTFDVPSHTNLLARTSTSTPNAASSASRKRELAPSRRDDQVVFAPLGIGGIAFGFEVQRHPELAGAVLQDFEHALAADADEAVARRGDRLAADMDVDIVPMRELVGDDRARMRDRWRVQILDRLVGEDHAPAEGHAGRVALEHLDFMRRIAKLHRDREIEAGGTGADAGDPHAVTRESCQS